MADNETFEVLARSPLFGGLPDRQLRAVERAGKEMSFGPGEELTVEGDSQGARFHLILDGTARVVVGGEGVRQLGRGDSVGEIALMDGGSRSATVVAETPLRTFSLASWNFKPLLREPEIAEAAIALLCRRLRDAEARSSL